MGLTNGRGRAAAPDAACPGVGCEHAPGPAAINRPPVRATPWRYLNLMTANQSPSPCGVLALEVAGILRVPGSAVLRVLWKRTQRAAAARECLTGGGDGIRRGALFDPIDNSRQHVEVIERGAAAAVGHTGHEEHAAPLGNLVGAAVG